MARITVEDCLEHIPNRFQLVLAATYRARMLSQGHAPKIESRNKPAVTALREIAQGKIGLEMLKRSPADIRGCRCNLKSTALRCFFGQKLRHPQQATLKG